MLTTNPPLRDSEEQAAALSTALVTTRLTQVWVAFPQRPLPQTHMAFGRHGSCVHSNQSWRFRVCLLPITLILLKFYFVDCPLAWTCLMFSPDYNELIHFGKKCCVLGHRNRDNTASVCLLASNVHIDIMVRWISLR